MLKTLGINLYTNIGKVLVEFIANAYDSDASKIEVQIPFDRITAERTRLRDEMKKRREQEAAKKVAALTAEGGGLFVETNDSEISDGADAAFEMLLQVLPDDVQIVLTDDGHGMSTEEVQSKFLPLNRNRRMDPESKKESRSKTESGQRFVMGRKGLGKLAGFGVAQKVRIWTKREGQTHATIILMDDDQIEKVGDLGQVQIPVSYENDLDLNLKGTSIAFSTLKSDALREGPETIKKVIRQSFNSIRSEDFAIYVNGDVLKPIVPEYEFIFPPPLDLKAIKDGQRAMGSVEIEDFGTLDFEYYIGFRKRGEHLPSKERGARVYCNNRLAAGPTLFDLGSGMHSFHSQDYMECIVEADDLDRGAVDVINTSRTQFKEGSDLIGSLATRLTEIMKQAIAGHAKFKEQQAQEEINTDPKASVVKKIVSHLPKKTRIPATKLLVTIASQFGVGTPEFDELAPIIVNSVNATEVFMKLIELGSKPETLDRIATELRELAEIEKVDALKHYRGRRSGIQALLALEQKGEDQWNKKQTEKEFHSLLKANPWLIRPEYTNYLSSDEHLNKVVSKIAQALEIDTFSKISNEDGDDSTRPDLVFLMSDPLMSGPHVLNIVELKSPSKALSIEHLDQLDEYIFKVEKWFEAEFETKPAITGYLIGAMPDAKTGAIGQQRLLQKLSNSTPKDKFRIIGIRQLIKDALAVHLEAINTLQQELSEDEDDEEISKDTAVASESGSGGAIQMPA
ncbi:ATP-binding protein [Mesorhizobium sp. B2-4-4]|uniref:ATP-binding protein n=1 Tax=Mesorhizobium sp. B2-4-4 TaxID=2589945 RepID=UPI0015E35ADE|nr:ATP-binding protein [Mesorhizobium sp. B2-4-4]